jgi:hypothetical protein
VEGGDDHLVQGRRTFELCRERRDDAKIIEDLRCETGKFLANDGNRRLGADIRFAQSALKKKLTALQARKSEIEQATGKIAGGRRDVRG